MHRAVLGLALALIAKLAFAGATFPLPADDNDFRAKRHDDAASGLDVAVASFRTPMPDGRTRLTYNVCNLEGKALLFQWPKPGFESGIANPVGAKRCAVYSRDVPESILDDNAGLLYWQSGEPRTAQAFLGKQSGWGKARRYAVTWLYARGLGAGPDKPDQVKDVEIIVTELKGRIDQQINWAGKGMSVALKVAELDDKAQVQLRAQIGGQGKLMTGREFVESLSPQDQARVPGALREGFVLVLSNQGPAPASAKIWFEIGENVPGAQPVAVLDARYRVMWIAQYSTVRRN